MIRQRRPCDLACHLTVLPTRLALVGGRGDEHHHILEKVPAFNRLPVYGAAFQGRVPQESSDSLKALTEGVHSKEALETVKEHVRNVMGPASIAYSHTMLKMSKLQAAQVPFLPSLLCNPW